jgi:carbon-monoxide dehydrogenase medium subunit
MDIATVCLAVLVEISKDTLKQVRIAAGAVAPVPLRLTDAEAILWGCQLNEDILSWAAQAAMTQVSPITDLRSTAEYRRDLVGVFLKRAIQRAAEDAR